MLLILHKGEFVHKTIWHFEMLEETVGNCALMEGTFRSKFVPESAKACLCHITVHMAFLIHHNKVFVSIQVL